MPDFRHGEGQQIDAKPDATSVRVFGRTTRKLRQKVCRMPPNDRNKNQNGYWISPVYDRFIVNCFYCHIRYFHRKNA